LIHHLSNFAGAQPTGRNLATYVFQAKLRQKAQPHILTKVLSDFESLVSDIPAQKILKNQTLLHEEICH